MKNTKFEIGDWIFHDFEVRKIITNQLAFGASDGNSTVFPAVETIFHLDMKLLSISNYFYKQYDRFYTKYKDSSKVNFADIHRYFVNIWNTICNNILDEAPDLALLNEEIFNDFVKKINLNENHIQEKKIHGVQILNS